MDLSGVADWNLNRNYCNPGDSFNSSLLALTKVYPIELLALVSAGIAIFFFFKTWDSEVSGFGGWLTHSASTAQIGGCADGGEFVKILQPSLAYAYHVVLLVLSTHPLPHLSNHQAQYVRDLLSPGYSRC